MITPPASWHTGHGEGVPRGYREGVGVQKAGVGVDSGVWWITHKCDLQKRLALYKVKGTSLQVRQEISAHCNTHPCIMGCSYDKEGDNGGNSCLACELWTLWTYQVQHTHHILRVNTVIMIIIIYKLKDGFYHYFPFVHLSKLFFIYVLSQLKYFTIKIRIFHYQNQNVIIHYSHIIISTCVIYVKKN